MKTTLFSLIPLLMFAGGPVTGNRSNTSLMQEGGLGGTFSASYGQLYFASSEEILITDAATWVDIPFDTFGPSSNTNGSTASPATLTLQEGGVYQLNVSLYFSSDESNEGTFNQTTYTLGIGINGNTPIENAAVLVKQAGTYSLNFTTIQELTANDFVRFYMQASNVGSDPIFDNIVTLLQGSANLIQIGQ